MIRVYWKNATSEVLKSWEHGITGDDLASVAPLVLDAHKEVARQCREGKLGYAALPDHKAYRASVTKLAKKYRPQTTDLVVLGIGGSALGNLALQSALNPATYNLLTKKQRGGGPRMYVMDNVDPALVGETLDFLRPRLQTTLVNVISKSGETAETASQFMIFREVLREKLGKDFAKHIVATTDANKGTLHDIAKKDRYKTLVVPDDVGGRFSVLTPVGLFTAAMCGIDIKELLAGAGEMRDRVLTCQEESWTRNPACILTAIKYLAFARKGKPMHVMMPYSNRLYLLADWYRQLWAESLGKQFDRQGREVFTGPTPIKALGTTDQHSQVQLYREGPNDKLTVFLEVADHGRQETVPDVFGGVKGLTYLRGKGLGGLLNAEKTATEYAMAVSKRPTITIKFDAITPRSVGEFIFLYEFVTSLMGEMLNVNAYDQPAVELGKQATFGLMGREGYEAMREKIGSFAEVDEGYLA